MYFSIVLRQQWERNQLETCSLKLVTGIGFSLSVQYYTVTQTWTVRQNVEETKVSLFIDMWLST